MQFDALNSLPYRRFWLGSIASIGSTQLYFIGMAWLVFELSGSALDLGLLGAATAIPTIVSSLVGGILADRFNRRSILVVTTSLAAILLLLLTILDATGVVLVWHVLVLSGMLGLVQGFDFPARASIFPALIEPPQRKPVQPVRLEPIDERPHVSAPDVIRCAAEEVKRHEETKHA